MTSPSKFDFVALKFTAEEWSIIDRAVNFENKGGWQGALLKMLPRVDRKARTVTVSPVEILTFEKYAKGEGGYQDRFRAILAAVGRARS